MRSPVLWIAVLALGAAVSAVPSRAGADGKQTLLDQKCNKCHSLKALGVEKLKMETEEGGEKEAKGPDLSDVGLKVESAEWITKWLNKEIDHKSIYDESKVVKHKKKFKGTPEELKAFADFLMSQKKKME